MHEAAHRKLLKLLGKNNYIVSIEDRIMYAYDASGEKCMPEAVVFPKTVEQISKIMKIANEYRIPIVPRGAGSGLTGGSVPLTGGIVMVMGHLNRIIEIDLENLQAIVEPGLVTADLHAAVEKVGLFYPPDPASMTFCTIGGNIAENAGGMRAVKYGVTIAYVMGLEVVLPTGEIIHTGSRCIKDVVGYDLTRLFVGSEGTLGIITKAILKLLTKPKARQTLAATFASIKNAAKTVPAILKGGIIPTTLEFMDKHCIQAVEDHLHLGFPKAVGAMLLIEVDGKPREIEDDMDRVWKVCEANDAIAIKIAKDEDEQEELWKSRRSVHAALQRLRARWEEEDISVPIARIPDMITKIEKIGQKYGLIAASFGHAGDGNIHVSLAAIDDETDQTQVHQAKDEILKATIALEGRIAAEHGIGSVKKNKIGWNIDEPTLALMYNIKKLVDPNGILNPGKIFPPEAQCRHEI